MSIEFEVVLACDRCNERRKITAHFEGRPDVKAGGHYLAVEYKNKPEEWKVAADGKVTCPAHRD